MRDQQQSSSKQLAEMFKTMAREVGAKSATAVTWSFEQTMIAQSHESIDRSLALLRETAPLIDKHD